MATILLVEEHPDLGFYEAGLLSAEGHQVFRCNGGATPLTACPMLKNGSCPLPEASDVIVYSGAPSAPLRGRTYRGRDLLRAYRRHPIYGCKPMLVVSYEKIDCLEGSGPLARIEKFSSPAVVVGAIEALLSHAQLGHHADRREELGAN